MMQEIWKSIPEFEGLYEVSNLGRIKSLDRTIIDSRGNSYNKKGKVLSLTRFSSTGYRICTLCKKDFQRNYLIHRLVAEAFVPNDSEKSQVNHIDGDILNNNATNLEWNTPKENSNHAVDIGLYPAGERRYNSKLSEIEVKRIYELANNGTLTQKEIAKKFNISQSGVSNIKNGKCWALQTENRRNDPRKKYAS